MSFFFQKLIFAKIVKIKGWTVTQEHFFYIAQEKKNEINTKLSKIELCKFEGKSRENPGNF